MIKTLGIPFDLHMHTHWHTHPHIHVHAACAGTRMCVRTHTYTELVLVLDLDRCHPKVSVFKARWSWQRNCGLQEVEPDRRSFSNWGHSSEEEFGSAAISLSLICPI